MRIDHVGVLAAGFLAVVAPPALAEELDLEPARFVFGDAGELFVECDSPDGSLAAKEEPREFADWADFADTLKNELNAIPIWKDNGEVDFDLTTYTYCDVVYLSPGVREPVQTQWPALVYLGGTTGYVFIADKAKCVNPELCNPDEEVTPLMVESGMALAATDLELNGSGTTWDRRDYRDPPVYPQYVLWMTLGWRPAESRPFCCRFSLDGCTRICRSSGFPSPANSLRHEAYGWEGGDDLHPVYKAPFTGKNKRYICVRANTYSCTTSKKRYEGGHAEPDQWLFNSTTCKHEIASDDGQSWSGTSCTQMQARIPCP